MVGFIVYTLQRFFPLFSCSSYSYFLFILIILIPIILINIVSIDDYYLPRLQFIFIMKLLNSPAAARQGATLSPVRSRVKQGREEERGSGAGAAQWGRGGISRSPRAARQEEEEPQLPGKDDVTCRRQEKNQRGG